jgi:hypothetical protein|tara:strand:+ start:10060 stop:10251 length:192 start_codon:yes stop_codon:yes gene_type:complete
MNKNMFDPNMMKNLNEMMKNINIPQVPTQNPFGFGGMKKYIFALAGLLMLSGFGIGVLVGLLF